MFILGRTNPLLSRYNLRDVGRFHQLELDAYDQKISTLGGAGLDFRAHGFGQLVLRGY